MTRAANTPEMLWGKVEKHGPDECWPWLGWRNAQGYGRVQINGKAYYAHRVIFALAHPDEIDSGAPKDKDACGFVLHKCDNPPCCNPAHLFVGTHADNMADRSAKGRVPRMRGEHGPRAKLTDAQAKEIRWLSSLGLAASEMARVYGVSKPTVKSIVRGRAY